MNKYLGIGLIIIALIGSFVLGTTLKELPTQTANNNNRNLSVPSDDSGLFIDLSKVRFDKKEALFKINIIRREFGAPELVYSASLEAAGLRHAKNISRNKDIRHIGTDGSKPEDRAKDAGYNGKLVVELAGVGFKDFGSAIQSWSESKIHLEKISNRKLINAGVVMLTDKHSYWKTHLILMMGSK